MAPYAPPRAVEQAQQYASEAKLLFYATAVVGLPFTIPTSRICPPHTRTWRFFRRLIEPIEGGRAPSVFVRCMCVCVCVCPKLVLPLQQHPAAAFLS